MRVRKPVSIDQWFAKQDAAVSKVYNKLATKRAVTAAAPSTAEEESDDSKEREGDPTMRIAHIAAQRAEIKSMLDRCDRVLERALREHTSPFIQRKMRPQ